MFARATPADRLARFGCGGVLASLVSLTAMLYGGLDMFGGTGAGSAVAVALSVLFIGGCGVVSALYGDRFVLGLLKLAKLL